MPKEFLGDGGRIGIRFSEFPPVVDAPEKSVAHFETFPPFMNGIAHNVFEQLPTILGYNSSPTNKRINLHIRSREAIQVFSLKLSRLMAAGRLPLPQLSKGEGWGEGEQG